MEEQTEKIGRLQAQLESSERAEKEALRLCEEERVSFTVDLPTPAWTLLTSLNVLVLGTVAIGA